MPFDGFVLAAIRKELEEKTAGCFIDRIYQPFSHSVVLKLRRAKERTCLFLSAHPINARVHLIQKTAENPASPPIFCMVLRKHLEGGRIGKITQAGMDRVLILEIEAKDEFAMTAQKRLICEIMGKHSNIILINGQTGQIIDAIKRYSHLVSRYREVLPGKPYHYPPGQGKFNPLFLQEEEFARIIFSQPLESPLEDVLFFCLDGFSKILAREVVYRADLPLEMTLNECGDYEFRRLWQALQEIVVPARSDQFQPTLVFSPNKYIDFAAFDLTHFSGLNREKGAMNTLVDLFYKQKEAVEELEGQRQAMLRIVRKGSAKLQKNLALHEESLQAAQMANEYKLYGELLISSLHTIAKGQTEAVLENYYEREDKPVCIPLDPGLTPVENARAYFKKYNRAKHTLKKAQEFITNIQRELVYLASVEHALQQSATGSELREIKEELFEQGYMPKTSRLKEGKASFRVPGFLTFTSSDGSTILIGKNNKQNDYLTLRVAKSNDIWLHVKNIPGAHVIIRASERKPTLTALREAASLAAYYSQGRYSQNVPVDYTLRKNVHKPQGARPGFVIYKGQRTIQANPEEKLVKKLSGQQTLPKE